MSHTIPKSIQNCDNGCGLPSLKGLFGGFGSRLASFRWRCRFVLEICCPATLGHYFDAEVYHNRHGCGGRRYLCCFLVGWFP